MSIAKSSLTYLAIMDRVAELWLQKFPERAAYSPGYWHLFMGLYKNRKTSNNQR